MSSYGQNYFEQHFFFSNRIVQFILGLRPYQTLNEQFLLFFTVIVYVFPMIAHQFYQIIVSNIALGLVVKELQQLVTMLCYLIIYSSTYFKFTQIRQTYDHYRIDQEQLTNEDEINITEKYLKETKKYVYFLLIFSNLYFIVIVTPCFLNDILYNINSFKNVNLSLPFPINNVSNSGTLYYSLLIYQMIACYVTLNVGTLNISMFLNWMQHACCQLSILRFKICKPFQGQQETNQKAWYNDNICDEFNWIVDIIKHYIRITKFIYLYNSFSKDLHFFLLFLSMLLIATIFVHIFQLSESSNDLWVFIECSISFGSGIFTIYIICYFGQTLINHSISTYEELCNIPFYILSIKVQKMLIFVILKTAKPCTILIGNMYVSSYEIFTGIMQKGFSFATVYNSIR